MFRAFICICCLLTSSLVWGQGSATISTRLQQKIQNSGPTQELQISILLSDRVDVRVLDQQLYAQKATIANRTQVVIAALKKKATTTQTPILDYLNTSNAVDRKSIRAYWVTNVIFCTVTSDLIRELALRTDIDQLDLNVELLLDAYEVAGVSAKKTVGGHELGHDAINAPAMWAKGYSGYGRKVMSLDTGVDPYHPAIVDHFDGYYHDLKSSWFVLDRPPEMPTDCSGHGTHTVGTMCGLDTANNDTIGVAWGARWIGSPNLCGGGVSTDRSIAAFQWAMDPDSNTSTIEDMPDVINNSWYDPSTVNECNGVYVSTFNAVEAVGIAIVYSAGNSGSGASTITQPKNINTDLVNVFCVGNVNGNIPIYPISSSSSRGPSTCGGTGSLSIKPEVSAPGTNVRSCYRGGYNDLTGTSMAAPHVCGAIALLKEPFPYLTGSELKLALYYTCLDLGAAGEDNTYGMGLIDVATAFDYLVTQGNIPVSPPKNDAAVINVLGIDAYTCESAPSMKLVIENRGTFPLVASTVLYSFDQGDTLTIQWSGNLAPMDTAHITIPVQDISQGTHEFSAHITLPNAVTDERTFNDKIRRMIAIPEFANVGVEHVCVSGTATLIAEAPASGAVSWFAQSSGSPEIGTGLTYTSPTVTSNTVFYADVQATSSVGKLDSAGSGGWTSGAARYLVFDCFNPFTLVSVLVYSDQAGTKRIDLRDDLGVILDSITVTIPLGETRVLLDFDVVPGTNLRLGIAGPVDLYRNSNLVLYPYTVPGVLSIKTSDQGPKYYYYFYDWEVSYWSPCGRSPAPIYVNPAISVAMNYSPLTYNLLEHESVSFQDNTSGAASWLWDFGDSETSTNPNVTHSYPEFTRTYNVELVVADTGNACKDSLTIQYEVISGAEDNVFPNPSSGQFAIDLGLLQSDDVTVSLYDLAGKMVLEDWSSRAEGTFLQVDLTALNDGSYIIVIELSDQKITERLVKVSK